MARHYAEVKDGKVVATTNDFVLSRPRHAKRFESMSDGLYRVTITSDRYGVYVTVGKACNRDSEIKRLKKSQTSRKAVARTGAPGIAGFQQAANASTSRLGTLWTETQSLIVWLEKN